MRPRLSLKLLTMLALLGTAPALGQSQTEGHGTRTTPEALVTPDALRNPPSPPLPSRPVVSLNTPRWQAGTLLGADVYSSENRKIAKVQDLLFNERGELTVVLSVGGFLGMGGKQVAVPYQSLQYSERWVLPGNTQRTLEEMPEFKGSQEGGAQGQTKAAD